MNITWDVPSRSNATNYVKILAGFGCYGRVVDELDPIHKLLYDQKLGKATGSPVVWSLACQTLSGSVKNKNQPTEC